MDIQLDNYTLRKFQMRIQLPVAKLMQKLRNMLQSDFDYVVLSYVEIVMDPQHQRKNSVRIRHQRMALGKSLI